MHFLRFLRAFVLGVCVGLLFMSCARATEPTTTPVVLEACSDAQAFGLPRCHPLVIETGR